MKVDVDINVFMDILTKRSGWTESLATIKILKTNRIQGYISALTIAVLYFLRVRAVGEMQARSECNLMTKDFKTVPLTRKIINAALASQLPEFEDNIQFYSAKREKVDYLITRNKKHFGQQEIPVATPDEFLKVIGVIP
jgi:hypothetical protein